VLCPCCKHLILEERLRSHARKCSAPAPPSYYREDCNSLFLDEVEEEEGAGGAEEGDDDGVDEEELKHRVAALYQQHVAPILLDESGPPPLHCDPRVEHLWRMDWHQKGMGGAEAGAKNWRRHRAQEASLSCLMLNRGLLPSPSSCVEEEREEREGGKVTTVVDFGSGKGSLCVALASVCRSAASASSAPANQAEAEEKEEKEEKEEAEEAEEDFQFLCIDRARVQFRAEKTVGRRSSHRTHRLRADLSGLDLGAALLDAEATLSVLRPTDLVVGVGKHLCGPATDMALQALARLEAEAKAKGGAGAARCKGLAIATCCHSAIPSLRHSAAGPWLRRVGFSTKEFSKLRRWAGGFTQGGEEGERGRQCKRLIDFGRREFVQRTLGLRCELVTYTDASSSGSPENCCLVAFA